MPFDDQTAKDAGRKGGRSRSDKKLRAARRNAKNGGRKPSRTLAERLVGQKLTAEQVQVIERAWSRNQFLLIAEAETLFGYFEVSFSHRTSLSFDTTMWRRKTTRAPKKILYLIDKFRRAAKYHLDLHRAKPVKDYVVVTRQPSREECEEWERSHPDTDVPCPPHRHKQYFRELRGFNFIASEFKRNPKMTAHDIKELGGGAYGGKGEAILAYLRSEAD
jgi:hypothetical protein